jgi:iron complex outermembrane receptor protein
VRSLFLASSITALAGPTLAQQAPAAPARPGQQATVQEIIVTAQRQSQSLLSVPMSISASTGEQLEKAGLHDLSQLQFTQPGYVPAYSSGYVQVFIRGVGNSNFVVDPSVQTFIDDVPRLYGSMVENFVDVDRVEVLKGAQGGLYGRNATGGVVNIITHQPSTENYYGNGRLLYGEKNTLQVAMYENIPISKQIAWSFSIERDQHDPYVKNIAGPAPYTASMFPLGFPIAHLNGAQVAGILNSAVKPPDGLADQDFWAVDSKVLLKPTDDLKITVAGDYARKHDTLGNQIFYDSTTEGVSEGTATAILGGILATGQANDNPFDYVHFPPGFFKGSAGDFTAARGIDVFTNLLDYGGSVTAVWSLPKVDLTSISAYRAQQTDFNESLQAAPVPTVDILVQNRKWFIYQELRAISTDTGPFHYLAGVTYLSNNFHGGNKTSYFQPLGPLPPTVVLEQIRNWSIYGQLGYDFTSQLNLTVSGRYMDERNTTTFFSPVNSAASLKESKFVPAATLSYALEGGGNAYVRWARGFKTGGVNPISAPVFFASPNQGSIFGPETVDTYEVGWRAPLFDRTVQVTTAAFYNDYKNLQAPAHANAEHADIALAMVNAGSARTYGFEGSVTWRVNQEVTLNANAGYLNAKYKTFVQTDATVLVPFDLSGATMPFAPKWQLSFTGDLDHPLNDQYRLVGNILVSHLSTTIFTQSGLPGILPDPIQPGYWLANLRLGVRTTDDKYGLAVFANNLFDRAYTTYGSSSALGNQLTWGNPRIVGAEVTAKW